MNPQVEQVEWSESYSMRIKKIDDQHKGLLKIVNDLYSHSTGDERAERMYFMEVIGQAVQYIKEHFATEERIMIATKFPGYQEHKKAHDEFTMTVVQSLNDFKAGKQLVLVKFAHFLKDWVLTHIAVMDVQYAAYFRQIATRKANGKLSITKEDIELQG
ncbi:MAG: bacteriohemerythrin [Treponema sp.]|nr:bacteriohemerythrin [Treponema sp.]